VPDFRGDKNLHLGDPVWAASTYDPDSHEYVVSLDAAGAKKFRPVADEYGFREVKSKADDSKE